MTSRLQLHCSTCGVALTNPLSLVSNDPFDLCETDGEPRLAKGGYYIAADDDWAADGHYVVNVDDLMNVANHALPGRLNGCCGLDGCDGINTICCNGHDVAIRRTDCWMPHYVAFPPAFVTINDS